MSWKPGDLIQGNTTKDLYILIKKLNNYDFGHGPDGWLVYRISDKVLLEAYAKSNYTKLS